MSLAHLTPLRWKREMGQGVKVLVVEDSDMVGALARMFLTEIGGMDVYVCSSDFGQCLLPSFWEHHAPTAALLDYNLGCSISGDEIARYLRDKFPTIRRVKWTANQILKQGPDPSGLYDWIVSKPFHPDELLEALRG